LLVAVIAGWGPVSSSDAVAPLAPNPPEMLSGHRRGRHPVVWFLVRRIAAGIATLLVASVLIFLATNALPGDIVEVILGKHGTPQLVNLLTSELHLNQSLLARYVNWLTGALHGDFGLSLASLADGAKTSVSSLIATPLLNSLVLAVTTVVLLIPLSMLIGTVAGVLAGRPTDRAVSYTALIFGALPEFVLGTFLILIFFSELNLLPPLALVPPGSTPLDHPDDLVLPVMTLLGVSLSFTARQVRSGVIETLNQDYVGMARLGGIREFRVLMRYALRNALAPSVQTFAQAIQYLFGGIIVVEALFAYPGIGSLLVNAVSVRDVTEIQAITLVLAAVYIGINIVADLIVVLLVPKLRTGL
jgi:peptide/nickel transport system permease protein